MPDPSDLAGLEREVVDHLFALQPSYAVSLGLHDYDGRLPDLSILGTDRWMERSRELLRRLDGLHGADLPPAREVDRLFLRLLLESPLFDLTEVRELDRNPMAYVGMFSFTSYMARDYAPPADRVQGIARLLEGATPLLRTGRDRLAGPLPRPFVELAVQIGSGLPTHFDEAETFASRHGLAREISARRSVAQAALSEFVAWLRDEKLPQATDDFALGAEKFQQLLWVREGTRTPVDEIRRAGEADLARNRARLDEIAAELRATPVELYRRLGDRHPAASEVLGTARAYVEETHSFVADNKLVSIPGSAVCQVEETPPYSRATTTASMSPPGPFDKTAAQGIYFVTLVDPAWPEAAQREWLRSLNHAMLKNITVHEVYPGHYLQFLHFREKEGSLARKVYLSNAFIEGWAHYAEQLAIEAGLDAKSPDAELAQIHDALLRDCRLLASIGLHTQGWTVERATSLFMEQAMFEHHPAQREAIRGTYNPEYFCYTLGKLAILDARKRWLAGRFGGDLRRFHDVLLASGCPPVGLLNKILEEPSGAPS